MTHLEARVPKGIEHLAQSGLVHLGPAPGHEEQIDIRVWREISASIAADGDDRGRRSVTESLLRETKERAVYVRRTLLGCFSSFF
jgi:hypothetical protein